MIVILALAWTISPSIQLIKQRIEQKEIQQQLQSLKNNNKSLKQEIKKMNDDKGIESIARQELGMARPGEETYVVVSPKEDKTSRKAETSKKKSDKNFIESVKSFIEDIKKFFD